MRKQTLSALLAALIFLGLLPYAQGPALADGIIIALLVAFVVRAVTEFPTPAPRLLGPVSGDCPWLAAQRLAAAGLSGTAALAPDGTLDLMLVYHLESGQPPDEAAQRVWDAFDVARELQKDGCLFYQIRVTVRGHGPTGEVQIIASVSVADLLAFHTGKMDEETFIGRVTYHHQHCSP